MEDYTFAATFLTGFIAHSEIERNEVCQRNLLGGHGIMYSEVDGLEAELISFDYEAMRIRIIFAS
jgi:hypothetical protein